jgi:hypothetical protein
MLPAGSDRENLAPTEDALVQLLRRRLDELHSSFSGWLLAEEHSDEAVAGRLRDDADFDQSDAVHHVLTGSFMRGLALFDHAISTGAGDAAAASRERFIATADAARDLNAVSHWWTATMASHLVDEPWHMSFHQQSRRERVAQMRALLSRLFDCAARLLTGQNSFAGLLSGVAASPLTCPRAATRCLRRSWTDSTDSTASTSSSARTPGPVLGLPRCIEFSGEDGIEKCLGCLGYVVEGGPSEVVLAGHHGVGRHPC